MGYGKWIGGVLGWILLGPIGGIIGFILGGLGDGQSSKYIGGESAGDTFTSPEEKQTGNRNSFFVSLLVLSVAVIKADNRFLKFELNYVKDFIRRSFGQQAVAESMQIIKGLMNKEINIPQVGAQIRMYMNYSQRIQLFHYLVGLARADQDICEAEIAVLRQIAAAIGMTNSDTESILSIYSDDIDSAYKVLEIDKSVSDDELKKAYRRMAIKYHPDKVASLGPEVQKAAEEKFKKVQSAYEIIKKERGLE